MEAMLIGDVIGSRAAADRAALHDVLESTLESVNAEFEVSVPLRLQLGDEFQGVFATLGEALAATLTVRVALLPHFDVRQGVGRGAVEVFREQPRVEDGPGWWSARAAIESVERSEARGVRTAYDPGAGATSSPGAGSIEASGQVGAADLAVAVNASLALRDDRVNGMDERSLSVLRGLMSGRSQKDVAAQLAVSASAVSQRVRGDGIAAVVAAHGMLSRLV